MSDDEFPDISYTEHNGESSSQDKENVMNLSRSGDISPQVYHQTDLSFFDSIDLKYLITKIKETNHDKFGENRRESKANGKNQSHLTFLSNLISF